MDIKDWVKFYFIFNLMGFAIAHEVNFTQVSDSEDSSTKVLSRKRRFLIYPDGSSFQLVFCTQNQGFLRIGDIVWFGNTAALAWELPTDPNIYQYFINSEKKFFEGNRRQDTKHIVYFDEDGKLLSKVPYHRKYIVNPAFAKRSIETVADSNRVKSISKKEMHATHKKKNFISELDKMSIKFHRDGRISLYTKIEKVLKGLGWKGKDCLRRLLCEHAKDIKEQGSFLQEIMRVIFIFPRSANEPQEYDIDQSADGDCEKICPDCEDAHGTLFFNDNKV